jgi:acetylornithine deacetylase/succinyl-diaminopimelate desuccinylase-like protein
MFMKRVLEWLKKNHANLVDDLAQLVAIQSISTDGKHAKEIQKSATATCQQMKAAGLQKTTVLQCGDSNPYAYGEWLGAPGKPTVFLYAHHDVQPINFEADWKSPPWTLTPRGGRLYGRGAADDKGAITAELGAVAAFLKTHGSLPVNVKMVVEGEEEIGSRNLQRFFKEHRERLLSDVIVVCDTENIEVGLPCITYALRGIVAGVLEVESAKTPVHSGMAGGFLADAAIALNVLLARLYWNNGPLPVPHLYDSVRPTTAKERRTMAGLPVDEAKFRRELGIPASVRFAVEKKSNLYEQTWRKPAVTVIAQEASSLANASNQVLPKAAAKISCRIVPDQDPAKVARQLGDFLTKDPPWGVKAVFTATDAADWWMTDPQGPAFEAAASAMHTAFGKEAVPIGCGGSIGFVGPLSKLFGGAPALLLGIEDPASNAHAPNESLHEGDFRRLMHALAQLFDNLGSLPGGKVK